MSDDRAAALRSALSSHEPVRISDPGLQDSAVLLSICERSVPVVPLVLRSDYRSEHAGEVGLPGGRSESEDGTLRRTALREANEEIGLETDAVEILGRLSDAATPTGYRIEPYVGHVPDLGSLNRDRTEVESIYLAALADLREGMHSDPPQFDCDAVEVQGPAEPSLTVRGTTAGILAEFFSVTGEAL